MNSPESNVVGRIASLEAALYMAGRPVEIGSLKRAVRTKSDRVVLKLARMLAKSYDERGSALEVKELQGGRVILQLRPRFSKMVKRFTNRPLLSGGPLRTLSYIAYYQPVEQMRVVSERGVHIYAQLRMMEEMGLIVRERVGDRGTVIRTTPYFADYFGFSEDPQRTRLQLQRIFSRMKITRLDNGNSKDHVNIRPEAFPPNMDVLADAGDGFAEGLAEYASPANQGSQ
jgi:segregation and condensation protein B